MRLAWVTNTGGKESRDQTLLERTANNNKMKSGTLSRRMALGGCKALSSFLFPLNPRDSLTPIDTGETAAANLRVLSTLGR